MSDDPKPFNPVILAPDGKPAKLPLDAACPRCGAGPDQRIVSGMGAWHDVTCMKCAFEFEKERAT